MESSDRFLLSGDEAVAHAAVAAGINLGTGYPGTPSTEILESFSSLGGKAQWAPNEKVAFDVALGVAFGGGRALVTMKHVGLNVAADPFFTSAYTGVAGGFVLAVADDPDMSSSQNEQDSRRYAVAAGFPMLEPSDSQEAYDFVGAAFEISERWNIPVMVRLSTRICHSKTVVSPQPFSLPAREPHFERNPKGLVMLPAYARLAHRRLRGKLDEIREWNESTDLNRIDAGSSSLGIIVSGISYMHVREAAPEATVLKLGFSYPLPIEKIKAFRESVERCVVIEENDPVLVTAIRAAGIKVDGKPEMYRFGELRVDRVTRILAGDEAAEQGRPRGRPPQLCAGCAHRPVFETLSKLDCIVAGDIGCYTLGALPPFNAMDTTVCMAASIGVGLGLRHVLPPDEARRVVSVIGDSTFVHGGIPALVEMVYNPPPSGHVVLILDNDTTAMTGFQNHPGTGRTLDDRSTGKVEYEKLARSLGIEHVTVIDATKNTERFEQLLSRMLSEEKLAVIIVRRPCVLLKKKRRGRERDSGAKDENKDKTRGS